MSIFNDGPHDLVASGLRWHVLKKSSRPIPDVGNLKRSTYRNDLDNICFIKYNCNHQILLSQKRGQIIFYFIGGQP